MANPLPTPAAAQFHPLFYRTLPHDHFVSRSSPAQDKLLIIQEFTGWKSINRCGCTVLISRGSHMGHDSNENESKNNRNAKHDASIRGEPGSLHTVRRDLIENTN